MIRSRFKVARRWLFGKNRLSVGFGGSREEVSHENLSGQAHVILLDGTMSSLFEPDETNVGLIFKILRDRPEVSVYYEPGIQWRGLMRAQDVIGGVGINRQIQRAYMSLARRYRPGDRIYFVGYSRGAYAVRVLAGLIDRLGLLQHDLLTPDRVSQIYAYYQDDPSSPEARSFVARTCYPRTEIEAIFAFDTVRSLGAPNRLLGFWVPKVHSFPSNLLGHRVKKGFHALALHEKRLAFKPELWRVPDYRLEDVEQVWFAGTHGVIGGQLAGDYPARKLSNIPLLWMLQKMSDCGVPLPPMQALHERFAQDADAVSPYTYRGAGNLFVLRARRSVGRDASEKLHPSAQSKVPRWVQTPPILTEV